MPHVWLRLRVQWDGPGRYAPGKHVPSARWVACSSHSCDADSAPPPWTAQLGGPSATGVRTRAAEAVTSRARRGLGQLAGCHEFCSKPWFAAMHSSLTIATIASSRSRASSGLSPLLGSRWSPKRAASKGGPRGRARMGWSFSEKSNCDAEISSSNSRRPDDLPTTGTGDRGQGTGDRCCRIWTIK
jgi:hypothetical protein